MLATVGTGCVMMSVSQTICHAMEHVKLKKCSVETSAAEMMETGELAMESASIKLKLAMECVQWEALYVETVLGALLMVISFKFSKSVMENVFTTMTLVMEHVLTGRYSLRMIQDTDMVK